MHVGLLAPPGCVGAGQRRLNSANRSRTDRQEHSDPASQVTARKSSVNLQLRWTGSASTHDGTPLRGSRQGRKRILVLLRKRLRLDQVRFTKRRVIVTAAVVVVVVGGGVGAWAATRPAAAAATRGAPAPTTPPRQTLSSSGTIEPGQQDNLNFAVSGQVTAVNVAAGQQVTVGQALATVNSAALSATVAEAQASLSSDQARLSTDTTNAASSTQVAADQAAVTAAQNQVTNAQNALAEATLTSPITGTVASVNLTVGQQVSGSGGSTGSSGGAGGTGGAGGAGTGSAGTGSGTGTGTSTDQIVVISN